MLFTKHHFDYSQRVGNPGRDMRGLMLRDTPCKPEQELLVDGVWMEFSLANKGTKASTQIPSIQYLSLMDTAWGLRLLFGRWALLSSGKCLY